ncbi:MAG: hypothetical protein ACLP4V_33850, partial [Methylocella sp.]
MFTRRDGLKWTLALATTVVAAARPGLLSPAHAAAEPVFKVPPLGYGFDALEPYIDSVGTRRSRSASCCRVGSRREGLGPSASPSFPDSPSSHRTCEFAASGARTKHHA